MKKTFLKIWEFIQSATKIVLLIMAIKKSLEVLVEELKIIFPSWFKDGEFKTPTKEEKELSDKLIERMKPSTNNENQTE